MNDCVVTITGRANMKKLEQEEKAWMAWRFTDRRLGKLGKSTVTKFHTQVKHVQLTYLHLSSARSS